jgi:hypothetical protein
LASKKSGNHVRFLKRFARFRASSLATNDNWADTQQAEIQASGKAPPNAKESAIIIVRPPGDTTAIVSGKGGTTGNTLVEAYILPP